MKPSRKAACLAVVPAALVFASIFFADEIEHYLLARQGMYTTHCFGEPRESLASERGRGRSVPTWSCSLQHCCISRAGFAETYFAWPRVTMSPNRCGGHEGLCRDS